MKILAIETSCDETAAAVVENGRTVLSNVVLSQIAEHSLYGGVVPEIASRRHTEGIYHVVQQALDNAGLLPGQVDAVAVTSTPGLIGALLVGVNFAKGLAYSLEKPLIPVHHIRGHVAANYLAFPELEPPFLCLIVSGGHSHIVMVESYTSFQVLGRTRDDAAGEAFDKVARVLGFPYPGGIEIDKASEKGDSNAVKLPYPSLGHPYDFSFSGLKTAVLNYVNHAVQKGQQVNPYDVAASFQKTVCEILSGHFLKAASDYRCNQLAAAGGVSANSSLRKMLGEKAAASGAKLYLPPLAYCGDNAAMIGAQAYYEFLGGNVAGLSLNASASQPISL